MRVVVVPMMGLSPVSHMGHRLDVYDHLMYKYRHDHWVIGIGSKNTIFTAAERQHVLIRQWSFADYLPRTVHFVHVTSAGQTLAYAHGLSEPFGHIDLTILVGDDRRKFGEGLKTSIKLHKIPELSGGVFDSIGVDVLPPREHDFSGTRMRRAAGDGDMDTFLEHLGPNLDIDVARKIYHRTQDAVLCERLAINRR